MKLVQKFLTKNPCYKAGRKIAVKGLMLHSVGCPQPKASVFLNNWNRADFDDACVHGFIDGNDGTVYQTLPWNHRGWHGGGSSNNTHIGVEMCEPACIKYTGGSSFTCSDLATARAVAKRTYEAAVELFAMLCKQYGLNPLADGVVISHKEGHKRGIASNHGDPEHLWRGLGMSYTMNGFRQDVKNAMSGSVDADTAKPSGGYYRVRKSWADKKSQLGAYKVLANAKRKADENPGYYVFDESGNVVYPKTEKPFEPYMVRVSVNNLNIRKGPGTDYPRVGRYTGRGVFTIVEEANGEGASKWGLLKAYQDKRDGWISLDYGESVQRLGMACWSVNLWRACFLFKRNV